MVETYVQYSFGLSAVSPGEKLPRRETDDREPQQGAKAAQKRERAAKDKAGGAKSQLKVVRISDIMSQGRSGGASVLAG